MKEYIPREDALNFETKITADPADIQAISQGMSLYAEHIKAIPAADVAPVVHGRWIKTTQPPVRDDETCANCSECGEDFVLAEWVWSFMHYCPYCGAKMDGGETDA